MIVLHFYLLFCVNFVATNDVHRTRCYQEYSSCLITINAYENQYYAEKWCQQESSSLAIIPNETVQFAATVFINDATLSLNSDVITNGYRFEETHWKWINNIQSDIQPDSNDTNDYRYAYLVVSQYRLHPRFDRLATSGRRFICSYKLSHRFRCRSGYQQLRQNCYKMGNTVVTWFNARRMCLQEGGGSDLATFESGDLSLTAKWIDSVEYWIGLRKESWIWMMDRKYEADIIYFNWEDGSPDHTENNCLCVRAETGKWTNCACGQKYRYICLRDYASSLTTTVKTSTTSMTIATTTRTTTTRTTRKPISRTTTTTKRSITQSTTTISTVADSSLQYHSTLTQILDDNFNDNASEVPMHPFESGQNFGVILALCIGSVCLLIIIIVVVVIKIQRGRSGGVGPRQQDYPPQNIDQADAPNNVYAMVVPNTNESARSPSERTRSEIVYAELDLAPTDKMIQRASKSRKTPNQIFHHPAPKGSKRGRAAVRESEYANSIPLESVYDNIAPS